MVREKPPCFQTESESGYPLFDRSSLSQIFYKIDVLDVLKDLAKFTRKNLCCSLFLIMLQISDPFSATGQGTYQSEEQAKTI